MATANIAAPRKSTPWLPMTRTVRSVKSGPSSAPAVPPAAMTGNSRRAWPLSKSSTRKLQKTDSRNRFRTLMKT
jgi:hypothetical protein